MFYKKFLRYFGRSIFAKCPNFLKVIFNYNNLLKNNLLKNNLLKNNLSKITFKKFGYHANILMF